MDKQVYKISEVAKILGISRSLVYRLIAEGKIPAMKLGKKKIVVSKVSIQRILSEEKRSL
jgi:excisionase family DNA binding protein